MDALALFRGLLASDRARWAEDLEALRRRLVALRCSFGGREIVRVLRPKFVGTGEYAALDYFAGIIVGLARRLIDRALLSPELQRFLGLTEAEVRLMGPEPPCPDPVPFSRLDSFATADGPRFVELNAECPAGAGYADMAWEGLRSHPLVQRFEERSGALAIPTREGVLAGLLKAWRAAGRTGRPTILITDYLDRPTLNEFHILRDYFESCGYPAVLEDPRRLEFQEGRLVAQGRAVDLVYRRVLVNEFLERAAEVQPLARAVERGAVVMVNPFRAKAAHKKTSFAVLTGDFLDRTWMTAEERRAVDRVVPWTRRVREARTEYRGRSVDLLPFVLEHREEFVLKPNDEYGGKGVVLGWETTPAAFAAALHDAGRGDFVVQERVRPEQEPFPLLDRGLEEQPMIVDLDPYVYFGKVHGVLARLAAGALCNVTSGGGQTPVLLVPDD